MDKNNPFWPADPTAYNLAQQKKAMEERKAKIMKDIATMENRLRTEWAQPIPITKAMDLIENSITACGGEQKVHFLDVSRSSVILATRVPMSANLFQFLPESEDNPRFHKIVTRLLLQVPHILGVKWVPAESGAKLIVDLAKGGETQ